MKALISIGAVLAGVILGFAAVWVFQIFGNQKALARNLAAHAAGGGSGNDDEMTLADAKDCSDAAGAHSD